MLSPQLNTQNHYNNRHTASSSCICFIWLWIPSGKVPLWSLWSCSCHVESWCPIFFIFFSLCFRYLLSLSKLCSQSGWTWWSTLTKRERTVFRAEGQHIIWRRQTWKSWIIHANLNVTTLPHVKNLCYPNLSTRPVCSVVICCLCPPDRNKTNQQNLKTQI